MKITTDILMIGTGCSTSIASIWINPIQDAIDKFEINTPSRIAAFLANVGVESGGFTELVENLNYGKQNLANTWPSRYSIDQHAAIKIPNDLAKGLAGNPQAIANNCYANRMGNGDEASGDGWNCRGQGPIQITGKTNIIACGVALGIDLLSNTSLLQQPICGSMSAAWFFVSNGCNQKADAEDIAAIVKIINGQLPCLANNGLLRLKRYSDVLDELNAA